MYVPDFDSLPYDLNVHPSLQLGLILFVQILQLAVERLSPEQDTNQEIISTITIAQMVPFSKPVTALMLPAVCWYKYNRIVLNLHLPQEL